MMPGMPGGRQFAEGLSSGAFASKAFTLAAYSGVRGRWGRPGKPTTRGVPPDALAAGDGPPIGTSQTPVKSGNLASAAQSAAVGAGRLKVWAAVAETNAAEASATTRPRRHFLAG